MKLGETNIYAGNEISLRILASKGEKEVLVDREELKWHEMDEGFVQVLTLKEIAVQLISLGYKPVFYVWSELGVSGTIYRYGNDDPPAWVEHGTTRGYV